MKLTTKQLRNLRRSLYVAGSVGLKVAGTYGLLNEQESQVWLLVVSAVLDLAFFNVPLSGEGADPTVDFGDAD